MKSLQYAIVTKFEQKGRIGAFKQMRQTPYLTFLTGSEDNTAMNPSDIAIWSSSRRNGKYLNRGNTPRSDGWNRRDKRIYVKYGTMKCARAILNLASRNNPLVWISKNNAREPLMASSSKLHMTSYGTSKDVVRTCALVFL